MTQLLALTIVLSAAALAWIAYRIGRWHGREASADAAEARHQLTCGYYDSAMQQVRELTGERDALRAARIQEEAERDQALVDLAEANRRIDVLREDRDAACVERDAYSTAYGRGQIEYARMLAELVEAETNIARLQDERDALQTRLDRFTRRPRGEHGHFVKGGEAA